MGGTVTKVLSGLYVGGFDNVRNHEDLIAHCITHVLFVQSSSTDVEKPPSEVDYLNIHVSESDECGLRKNVMKCNDFIHTTRVNLGNVLVCSDSGISTNIAFVAAYLMSIYVLDAHDAVGVLQGLVPAAQPSSRMRAQLELFGKPRGYLVASANVTSLATACADEENSRLMDKYGPWDSFDDDFNQLSQALATRSEIAQSGRWLGNASELSQPGHFVPNSDGFQHGIAMKSAAEAITSPLHASLVPRSSSDPLQSPVSTALPAVTDDGGGGDLFGMDPNDPLPLFSDSPLNSVDDDDLLQEDLPDVIGRRVDGSRDNETGSEDSVPGSLPIQRFVTEFGYNQQPRAMSYQAGHARHDPRVLRAMHGDDIPGVFERFHEDVPVHHQLSTTAPVQRQFYGFR